MRQQRYYSLFEQQSGKWQLIGDRAYVKNRAVIIYQNKLLEPFFIGGNKRELRPLTEKQLQALNAARNF